VIPLQLAIHKLSKVAANSLHLSKYGELKVGKNADVLVFDPATIADHATYEKPIQYATGMIHVFVNGKQVLKDGQHTNAKPGKFVKGEGAKL
jgi:N-acyl-D-amino-acid deacylase